MKTNNIQTALPKEGYSFWRDLKQAVALGVGTIGGSYVLAIIMGLIMPTTWAQAQPQVQVIGKPPLELRCVPYFAPLPEQTAESQAAGVDFVSSYYNNMFTVGPLGHRLQLDHILMRPGSTTNKVLWFGLYAASVDSGFLVNGGQFVFEGGSSSSGLLNKTIDYSLSNYVYTTKAMLTQWAPNSTPRFADSYVTSGLYTAASGQEFGFGGANSVYFAPTNSTQYDYIAGVLTNAPDFSVWGRWSYKSNGVVLASSTVTLHFRYDPLPARLAITNEPSSDKVFIGINAETNTAHVLQSSPFPYGPWSNVATVSNGDVVSRVKTPRVDEYFRTWEQ